MPKFRKKPVVIEAVRYTGENADEIAEFFDRHSNVRPGYLVGDTLVIDTLEGEMEAQPGDWIIRGVAGEFYPCKPDIFEATYDPVEDG